MNIFVTSKDPYECAKSLDTKRVRKMILESAQMLYAALHVHKPEMFTVVEFTPIKKSGDLFAATSKKAKKAYYWNDVRIYAPCHLNHPDTIWVRKSRANYRWLMRHFIALSKEYTYRTGKVHASSTHAPLLYKGMAFIPQGKLQPFPNCAANKEKGISFKNEPNVYTAYKKYLNARFTTDKHKPVWDNRGKPEWVTSV